MAINSSSFILLRREMKFHYLLKAEPPSIFLMIDSNNSEFTFHSIILKEVDKKMFPVERFTLNIRNKLKNYLTEITSIPPM